jgi:hypothetical protein
MIALASWSKFDRRVAGYKRERPARLWTPCVLFRCKRRPFVSCGLTMRRDVESGSTTGGSLAQTHGIPGRRSRRGCGRHARPRVRRDGVSPVTRWAERTRSGLKIRSLRLRWVRRRSGVCLSEDSDTAAEMKGKGGVGTKATPHPGLEPVVEEAEDSVCGGSEEDRSETLGGAPVLSVSRPCPSEGVLSPDDLRETSLERVPCVVVVPITDVKSGELGAGVACAGGCVAGAEVLGDEGLAGPRVVQGGIAKEPRL